VIELRQVTKVYRKGRVEVKALNGVDLAIKDGELAVIVGVSGSGKTTLLNLIGGLDVPTSGSVFVNGADISKMDSRQLTLYRRQKVGFVFQFFYLIPTLTVLENVMLPLVPLSMSAKEKQEKALHLIEEVGLSERVNHLPGELSGGEQQRVAIARALVNDPQILLADEPTSDLDTETGNQIIELLRKFHAKGKTLIIATHDERLAQIASHVVRMRDGKVVEEDRRE